MKIANLVVAAAFAAAVATTSSAQPTNAATTHATHHAARAAVLRHQPSLVVRAPEVDAGSPAVVVVSVKYPPRGFAAMTLTATGSAALPSGAATLVFRRAGKSANAQARLDIPADTAPGAYTVSVSLTLGTTSMTGTTTLVVLPPASPTPSGTSSPSSSATPAG